MNLGLKIKELRKLNKITQQDLAEMLGVSYQAISRWENNITSPDITTLPVLANIFNVTVDYLLDVNINNNDILIKEIYDAYWSLTNEEKWHEAKLLLEEKIKLYPNSYFLKDKLLNVYYRLMFDNDKELYQDKIIKLANDIMHNSLIPEFKFSAIQSLIFIYESQGNFEKGKELLELVPDISYSKEMLKEHTLTGVEKEIAIQEHSYDVLSIFEHILLRTMFKKPEGERVNHLLKYKELLDSIFDNKDYGSYNYNLSFIYLQCAIACAKTKNKEDTLRYLNLSIEHIEQYFTLKEKSRVIKHTSFLVNKLKDDPNTWPLNKKVLFDDMYVQFKNESFDFIRNEVDELLKKMKL